MIRPNFRSLRLQIILGMAASIVMMFIFSTLALHFVLHHHIYDQFFSELDDRARTLGKYTEYEHGELSFEWAHYDARSTMLPTLEDGAGCLFKVWRRPGEVLAEKNIFDTLDLQPDYGPDARPGDPPQFKHVILPDGSEAYQVSFRFLAIHEDDEPVAGPMPEMGITVVRRTITVEQTMTQMDTTLLYVTTATMLLSIAGMWLLIHLGLKPLEPVLVQLKAIGEGDLSQRVKPGKLPAELVSMIQTVNDLLAALEIKVDRERRFVANAAHELRNPITAVRANLEVGLLNNDNPQVREEVGRSCLEAATHLQIVCERLLSLAGLQQDNISLELQDVDVRELVDSITDDLQEAALARNISFVWGRCDSSPVQTDPVLLNVILSNLLRNATAYASVSEPVMIRCVADESQMKISVSNLVSDDLPLDLEKVMEPFWRGEESRTLGHGHLGLGLTIANSAAEQLHGQVGCSVEASPDAVDSRRVFVATVTLPNKWPGLQQSR